MSVAGSKKSVVKIGLWLDLACQVPFADTGLLTGVTVEFYFDRSYL